jgi:serine/arginine repetitive matrix protein 2
VWSQVSEKSNVPASNSLKSINDDLPAIPFTLQDVKSEDGGTPPPGSGAPSRMSIHDVTRAFQQVPASSSAPSVAPAQVMSSPNTATQMLRRPSYGFPSPSMTASAQRPLYPAYPVPGMGSPSPAMVYPPNMTPNAIARPMPMNGPAQPYQQPMWYPVHPSTPGAPAGGMHHMHAPYSPQVMGYAPPGMHPGVYTPPMVNSVPPGAPPQGRGRGVPPVVTQPASGAYPPNPHQSYPSPITPGGRGHAPHAVPSPRVPPAHPASFNPVTTPYARTPW